jgi:hypothetical protein
MNRQELSNQLLSEYTKNCVCDGHSIDNLQLQFSKLENSNDTPTEFIKLSFEDTLSAFGNLTVLGDDVEMMEMSSKDVVCLMLVKLKYSSVESKFPFNLWIKSLPNIVLPVHWSETVWELLPSHLQLALRGKLFSLQKRSSELSVNLDDWMWADAIFWSRCLQMPFDEVCLIPLIDLANHSLNPSATWEIVNDEIILKPLHKDWFHGKEVSISYGDKSNDELLFHYGFTLVDNPHDKLSVPWTLFGDVDDVATQVIQAWIETVDGNARFARLGKHLPTSIEATWTFLSMDISHLQELGEETANQVMASPEIYLEWCDSRFSWDKDRLKEWCLEQLYYLESNLERLQSSGSEHGEVIRPLLNGEIKLYKHWSL